MDTPRKVCLYARVSTKEQSSQRQLADLRKYCEDRKWTIVEEFVDDAYSGKASVVAKRPRLAACLDMVRKRKVQALVVWSYDRFARSLTHLVNTAAELRDLGVDFVAWNNNVDTTTAQGRLIFGVLASLAEYVREMIVENVNSGLRNAKSCRACGHEKHAADECACGCAAYVPKKQLGPASWTSRPGTISNDKILSILEMKGASHRKIAEALGVSKGTVYRVLWAAKHQAPRKPIQKVAPAIDGAEEGFKLPR
jgi:DNA invertase Pin-like site-specific DNA recombinase